MRRTVFALNDGDLDLLDEVLRLIDQPKRRDPDAIIRNRGGHPLGAAALSAYRVHLQPVQAEWNGRPEENNAPDA
jgi:hypothetical protein